ncbi:MAG: hypothetical protein ABNG96_03095, partial [Flavobacterium sp.]
MSFKNLIISYSIMILILSCKSNKVINNEAKDFLKYKIIKIDSINNVYVIHAKENGLYYKILSLKNNNKLSSNKKIKQGNKYNFKLISLDVPMYVDGLDFHGEAISIERDSIYDLH